MKFRDIPRVNYSIYSVTQPWVSVEDWILTHEINLSPDFQRIHVWKPDQKSRYIEWCLKGGFSGRDIYYNHPGWMISFHGEMVCVDGKQRVDAVLGFLHNKVKAFGLYRDEFEDKLGIGFLEASFIVHVAILQTKREILQWYLDLNVGGVLHTKREIERVRGLLKLELEGEK